jgi:cytochrome c553
MFTLPRFVLVLTVLTLLSAIRVAEAQDALSKQAQAILKEHCFVCHGKDGTAEGGLNFILDVGRLVSRGIIDPKDQLKSKLYQRITSKLEVQRMPPGDQPLAPAKIETLRRWIEAGARDFNPPGPVRKFISPTNILEFIEADLKKIDAFDRGFQRYFTITYLYNAGIPDSELETYRRGLSKLLNSLSWKRRIKQPVAIDKARTVLRINLNCLASLGTGMSGRLG